MNDALSIYMYINITYVYIFILFHIQVTLRWKFSHVLPKVIIQSVPDFLFFYKCITLKKSVKYLCKINCY